MLVRQVKLKPCSGTSSGSLLRATKIPLCCTNLCMVIIKKCGATNECWLTVRSSVRSIAAYKV
ncbi:hypothetical protein T4E_2227 [Trichinella pseudospiralis]|uniref:Uncharacterized protein n=1 Tax=Trichinella pseudospiralis TaxID=6337 RepID=A0A0V0YLU6_TRIPS|nr:hypothetical protein T4E_2227 [Trichinella pseudospiralis]